MWLLFERAKKIILTLLLSIIPLVLLYLQNNDYKIRSAVSWPFVQISGAVQEIILSVVSNISDGFLKHVAVSSKYEELMILRAKVQENQMLHAKIAHLQNEINSIINLNENIKYTNIEKKVYAKIVAKSGTPMSRLVRINKGITSGVRIKDPVISDFGAVGQVLSVSDSFADVLLISDASSSIDAKILGSNARGLVTGITSNQQYLMQIRDIDALFKIKPNDIVVSSGMNSFFPEGIPIGKVKEVVTSKDGLLHSAKIIPFVFIDNVEHVTVLLEDPYSKTNPRLSAYGWPLAEK